MYVRSLDASINLGTTYRSAVSAYILEILTKQDNSQIVSKILCSRESEFLQYGTEIKKMFPNAKFIWTEVELERIKILRQLPGETEIRTQRKYEHKRT